jgi:hypothetical protein
MRKTVVFEVADNVNRIVNLGCIVTGLYNIANHHRRQEMRSKGKIPNYYQQYYALRDHRLARLLHSHVAQQVLKTVEYNYRSWFALRRSGHQNANPPAFRKPGMPSTFHFTNYGFKILDDAHIQLSTRNAFGENIVVKVLGRTGIRISEIKKPRVDSSRRIYGRWWSPMDSTAPPATAAGSLRSRGGAPIKGATRLGAAGRREWRGDPKRLTRGGRCMPPGRCPPRTLEPNTSWAVSWMGKFRTTVVHVFRGRGKRHSGKNVSVIRMSSGPVVSNPAAAA